jgi:hypothetical protein
MDAMAQAMSAWSPDTVTSASKPVQNGAIRFAKENAKAGVGLTNELTNQLGQLAAVEQSLYSFFEFITTIQ